MRKALRKYFILALHIITSTALNPNVRTNSKPMFVHYFLMKVHENRLNQFRLGDVER
jgi:hypothetical protein